MGAFVALPVAALITAFVSNFAKSHEIVYKSPHDEDAHDKGSLSETIQDVATDGSANPSS